MKESPPTESTLDDLTADVDERLSRLEIPFGPDGVDPFGISTRYLRWNFRVFGWMYRHYFRTEVTGAHNIPSQGRAMLVGNHSGGVALDAGMVTTACFFDMDPPRLAQGMAERFVNRVPFASLWSSRSGHFPGTPEYAERLLNSDRLLLVFPEGARGTAKLFPQRNSLLKFGQGFMRQALQTQTPIIPFSFLGAGEAIPTVRNLYKLGRLLGTPYVPITPYLLPIPLPVPLHIRFGAPMTFEGDPHSDDQSIDEKVNQVRTAIQGLMDAGQPHYKESLPPKPSA